MQSPITGLVVHQARVLSGEVHRRRSARTALVDIERRKSISRAHTATHMVHKAFREALGETATQAGSENAPGRFRFDFSATGAVPASVMADVEARVNDLVLADLARARRDHEPGRGRRSSGAMALFGEKYGDQVRVVSVGDWARELCGGTHAGRSGQLGVIKLLGESSIGSGVRRVEALVGADAYRFLAREHVLVAQLTEALKARPEELPERVNDIVERLRAAEKEIEQVRVAQLLSAAAAARGRRGRRLRRRVRRPRGSTAPAPATCARWRSTCAAGCQPGAARRGRGRSASSDGKAAGRRRGQRRGARPGRLGERRWSAAAMPLVGGRGGGKDDVAQGGGADVVAHRRGAASTSSTRSAARATPGV